MKKITRPMITIILILLALLSFCAPCRAYDIKKNYPKVTKDLEKIRGLKMKNKVPYAVKTRQFLKSFLLKTVKQEVPPARMREMDDSLKAFGFVPANFNTLDFLINLYTEQVAGLYDHRSKTLMLMKDGGSLGNVAAAEVEAMKKMGVNIEDMLLMHELEHAVQDQYFNLGGLIKGASGKHNDDYEYAVQSLTEGDAYLVMVRYVIEKVAGPGMADSIDMANFQNMTGEIPVGASEATYAKAPLYFKKMLLFPYLDGMVFVDGLKKRGGWTSVNASFKRPPKSTEQILHVAKYLSKDNPVLISFPKLPNSAGEWKNAGGNVWGEASIRIMFEQFLPGCDYKQCASGWGGDAYRIYRNGSGRFFVWFTTWDSKGDADRFFNAYSKLISKKYSGITCVKKAPKQSYLWKTGGKYCYAGISRNNVLVVEKCPKNLTNDMIKNGWKASRKVWN